eukprot:TRINITY_DN15928_c0_g1_i2.p1 TRINITY_DN15928_c0_g1~~TRINITY_DN15928_c0_g1_i2.p1  ORF type:complete len:790 (+),score=239.09 TRINITY_DN15928_c0_g1_i2:68-2437(+)
MDITVESEAEWLVRHGLGHLRRLVPEAVPTSLSLGRNAQIGAQVHGDHGSGELLGWRFRGDRFGDTTGGQPERDGDCKVKLEDGSVCVVPAADLCLTRQADAEDADPVRPPTPPSPLKAPECADLFMKFPLVPGRGVGRHCSPMWVRLVESLGIAVGMPKFRHASWEEHAGVKDGSRYVPTVLLFALRNATAIRRLQNSKVVSRAELNELLDHLTTLTPVSQDPDEQELGLLTPATMTALCGPAAGALTERLREIVLRYRNSKDRLDIAEFALVLRHEHQGLERHRAAVAEKSRLQRRKGEADSALVKHMHMFDAARGSLGDVDLATAAAALPSSMSLRDLLTDPDQAGLRPGQLVVVAVVQLCAAMSLLIEAPRHRDDADPLIAPELPHPSLRPPTIPDQAYWAQLQHLNGTDLLLSLPPFQHGMLAEVSCALPGDGGETWRHLVDCIVNDAGTAGSALVDFRPSHRCLALRADAIRRAEQLWRERIRRAAPDPTAPGMAVWHRGSMRDMLASAGHLTLLKLHGWLCALVGLAEPLRVQSDAEVELAAASTKVAVVAATSAAASGTRRVAQRAQENRSQVQRRAMNYTARVARMVAERRICGGDAIRMLPARTPEPGEVKQRAVRVDGEEGARVEVTVEKDEDEFMRVTWPSRLRRVVRVMPTAEQALRAAKQGVELAGSAMDPDSDGPPGLGSDVPNCKQDVSGVLLSDAQVQWLFHSLDTNHNGWLERSEVRKLYEAFDSYGVPSKDGDADALLGIAKDAKDEHGRPLTQVGIEQFRRMMLAIAKR